MRNRRFVAAWVTWLAVGGTLGATIAHGLYHRSDAYRRRVEIDLARFFGLPVRVGDIQPYSFTARQLAEVTVWLPDKRDVVFDCPRIVWDREGAPDGAAAIDIHQPRWSLGSEAWATPDYERVLRAGLRHDFKETNLREIRLHQARLEWLRPECHLAAEGVNGRLVFDPDGRAQADLICHRLNDLTVTEPISISARIDPMAEELLPEVAITVPTFPMASLGLDRMLAARVTQGSFSGRITLSQNPSGDTVSLAGRVAGAKLEEWTQRVPGGAVSGLLDLTIEHVRIRERRLEELHFRGEASRLDVDPLLTRFGWPALGGTAQLKVLDARLSDGTIERLHVAGQWTGGSLDRLVRKLLGRGGLQGKLRARINSLVLENNQIASGDVELAAEPGNGRTGTIDRELLVDAFQKYFSISVPASLLPDHIDYSQMGARIMADRQRVRVVSGHGPAGPAVITVRVLGQDMPIGGDLDLTFPLDDLVGRASKELADLKQNLVRPGRPSTAAAPTSRPVRPR